MVEKSCQFLKYYFCYDATKLKKIVKFYVTTWTLFTGPVTYGCKLLKQKTFVIFMTLNGIMKFFFTNIQSHEVRMNKCPYYHEIFTTSQKFYHEIFVLEQNSRNYKSILPQKFGAIQYLDISQEPGIYLDISLTTNSLMLGHLFIQHAQTYYQL